MRIRKPAADRYGVLRVEDVGCGGVVDNDGILQVSANLGKVLDVVTTMVVTTFSEQAVVDNTVDVQLIQ